MVQDYDDQEPLILLAEPKSVDPLAVALGLLERQKRVYKGNPDPRLESDIHGFLREHAFVQR